MATLAWRQHHPLVLPRHDSFVEGLAWKQHVIRSHISPKQLLAEVRKVTSDCGTCHRIKVGVKERECVSSSSSACACGRFS